MSEWISVKDRLPEMHGWNLASNHQGVNCYYWGGRIEGWQAIGVTHWQPLPQPPEQESDDGQ